MQLKNQLMQLFSDLIPTSNFIRTRKQMHVTFSLCAILSVLAPSASASELSGKAQWDMDMVLEFFRRQLQVTAHPIPQAYPAAAQLEKINPEFKKRVDALMCLYQSSGAQQSIGLVPATGGLRDAAKQHQLYAVCRRQLPNTTGKNRTDFVDIPAAQRNCQNCQCNSSGTNPGAATHVWMSWHEVGLAIDCGQFKNGKYDNGDEFFNPSYWTKVIDGAAAMGVIPGFWWSGEYHDPAHFEWHPQILTAVDLGDLAGKAVADDKVHPGYEWKIPSRIYHYRSFISHPKDNFLEVWDLAAKDNWIWLVGSHQIKGNKKDNWRGSWHEYKTPLRLFPAYLPVRSLYRNDARYEEDKKWRTSSEFKNTVFEHRVDGSGRVSEHYSQTTGQITFGPQLAMWNLQIESTIKIGQHFPEAEQFKLANVPSYPYIYRIIASIVPLRDQQTSVTIFSRNTDYQGFTTDSTATRAISMTAATPAETLGFAWDRDRGLVGGSDVASWDMNHINTPFEISEFRKNVSDGAEIISANLPPGAFDLETSPQIAENPKPQTTYKKQESQKRGSGFLRP